MRNVLIIFTLLGLSSFPTWAQESIVYGDNLFGVIDCSQTDTFVFEGYPGDEVLIHVVELTDFGGVCSGVACFCFDQQVELMEPNDHVLDVNSSPDGNNTQNRFRTTLGPETLQATGNHKISIHDIHNNGRGEYAIFLQNMKDPVRADLISSGQNLLGTMDRGEVHTYLINALPYDYVTIEMTAESVGNVDPVLELYDPDGQPVYLPDSGQLEGALFLEGTYTLLVYSRKDESGSYRLSMTVDIQVNHPPVANNDTAVTTQDNPVAIDVLINDTDPEEDNLTIVSVTQGSFGNVQTNGSYIVYTPDQGYIGIDSFYYEISDMKSISKALVTVVINSITGTGSGRDYSYENVLGQNYPNPFTGITNIEYRILRDTQVKLVVYDMLGRTVEILEDHFKAAGVHEIKFDGSGKSPGIYIYELTINNKQARKRMILL